MTVLRRVFQTKQGRSVHQQIMRFVIVIVLLVFLALGAVVGVGLRANAWDYLAQSHEIALNDIGHHLTDDLEGIADDLHLLAAGTIAREYAALLPAEGAALEQAQAQTQMLDQLADLVRQDPDVYLAARFLTAGGTTGGSTRAAVINYQGIMTRDERAYPNAFMTNPAFVSASELAPGAVYVSQVVVYSQLPGMTLQAPVAVFQMFSPVADLAQDGRVLGMVQVDVLAEPILESVNEGEEEIGRGRFLLVTNQRRVLADSGTENPARLLTTTAEGGVLLSQADSTLDNLMMDSGGGELHLETSGNEVVSSWTVRLANAQGPVWDLVLVDNLRAVVATTNTNALLSLAGSVALGLLVVMLINVTLKRALRPLGQANVLAQQLLATGSQPTVASLVRPPSAPLRVSAPAAPRDDVEQLMATFAEVTHQLQELNYLRVQANQRERNLDIAARIGRETATLRDVDLILNRMVNLICDEFGFYHAQIFLVDDVALNALLAYSRGEVGQKLLERAHSLPVGSASVIGQVTATNSAVIVNDTTRAEGRHAFNPMLPETRAEMALPMTISERVIGALDIQSLEPDVFHDEEVRTFQLLADQATIAIHNARLLAQSEQRVQQIDSLNRQLTRIAWEGTEIELGPQNVYRYNLSQVERSVEPGSEPPTSAYTAPIRIRGQVIGTLAATPPEGAQFSQGDQGIIQAVAERVALALENARLFQETQTSLNETSVLYQLSRYLSEANTLEDVIQAILAAVMLEAESGQVALFNEYEAGTRPEWLAVDADLATQDRESLVGERLKLADSPFLSGLRSNQVTLIQDVERDTRLDATLRDFFGRVHARAAAIVPFSVRGAWRGIILVEFSKPHEFSEREGRIYSALIDQAGVAIENRLLLRQTEMTLTQIEQLYAASRIINTAQALPDLVQAALAAAGDPTLNYALGLLQGELDSAGWPTQIRMVAQSSRGEVKAVNTVYPIVVAQDSPLQRNEPQIIRGGEGFGGDERGGGGFTVAFPLFSANVPIALFYVTSEQERALTEQDYEIYRALTGQMATVIQNQQLLQQTAQALDETRRLYAASRAISSAQDFDAVYRTTSEHLAEPHVSFLSIALAGPEPALDAPYLDYVYVWANEHEHSPQVPAGTRANHNDLPLGAFTEQRGGLVGYFGDLTRDLAGQTKLRQALARNGAVSAIVAPLQSHQLWFGGLIVESRQLNAFDEQYVRFVQAVANQVAIAIENRRLFEEAQQAAQRALALAEVGQLASRVGSDFQRSLNEVFERVADAASYDRWLLVLQDEMTHELEQVTWHTPGMDAGKVSLLFDLSLPGHPVIEASRTNQTILINTPAAYPAYMAAGEEALRRLGKHVAMPVSLAGQTVGALLMGRGLDTPDLDERDEELIQTLAAQIGVAVENRRLFRTAEREQQTLRSILDTLPAGVLVLDAHSYRPIRYNTQTETLLGRSMQDNAPFSPVAYNLYRTGTNLHYPEPELPIFQAVTTGEQSLSDDIAVIQPDGFQTDLLINAAPIRDQEGNVTAIVAAFEDISNLRNLENVLQSNLRETTILYEATRALSEADELDAVLDVVILNLAFLNPSEAGILLSDEHTGIQAVRTAYQPREVFAALPQDILDAQDVRMIADVTTYPDLGEEARDSLQALNILAVLTIPLQARGRDAPLGWLLIAYDTPHEFTEEEQRFMTTMSDSAAVAIDNRQLVLSTQRALQETGAIYSATTEISRTRDIEGLIEGLKHALSNMQPEPDMVAAYMVMTSDYEQPRELFNDSLDSAPAAFGSLMKKHELERERAIFVHDLTAIAEPDTFERDLLALGNVRALATVNLRVTNAVGGRLFVAYHQPHHFGDSEARYLNAVADSASVVMDNILLFEQIQTTLEETSILYTASRALADATTPQDILNAVVNHMLQPHINQVFLALLLSKSWEEPDATILVTANWLRTEDGIDLQGVRLTANEFPAWRQLSTQTVLTVDDTSLDESLDMTEQMSMESLNARSLAVIPLRVPMRAIGAIWLGSPEPYKHSAHDLRIYQAFGEQASLSLEALHLLEQTERRARQLQTTAQVSQFASSLLDLEELMPRLVDLIRDAFRYDHVQIFLMDDEDDFAMLRASTGEAGQQLLDIGHKLQKGSSSVIGTVTRDGVPVVALDTADANVVHRPNPYLPLTRSELALPLVIKGRIVGALDVQSNQPNFFSDEDVSVLSTLAAQIAVAIDNARLFNQAERRASDMSFLFAITSAAAGSATLDEALGEVATLLHESLGALTVSLYLPENRFELSGEPYTMMRPVALAGADQPLSELTEVRVGDEDNLIGVVAQEQQPQILARAERERRYLPVVPSARSAVIVPLTSVDVLVGLIGMEDAEANAYDQETLTLLLTLSGTLSAIIQNWQLLEQVQRTNEQLRELDRLKTNFLASMSHELRTPLNSIIGFSRVILKGIDGPLTEMQEQDLTTIYNSGKHLLNLINDILDQAKIAANKALNLEFAYFDIKSVIDAVRSMGIGLVKDKPIDIRVDIASGLPQAYGDEFRVRQVVLNLVSNASKFTFEGYIGINAYRVEHNGKTMIRLDVTDTGIGIDEKDMPVLFEPFRQVDSSLTRIAGGTGLGLPLAKSLIEMQGGEIIVTSQPNVGSTFSILIPTEPTVDVEEGQAAPPTNGDTPVPPSAVPVTTPKIGPLVTGPAPAVTMLPPKRQILVIEDNPDMVDQFRRILQREGFDVFTASIPLEAQAMASGLHPMLIVMDVNFASGAGWEILGRLKDRDDTSDIPVIVATFSDETEKILDAGAHSILQRPFEPEELTEAVAQAESDSTVERILIIDDEPDSARLLKQLLDEHGRYRVFTAQNGAEGIGLVARRRPDLVILDLRMPDMDGFAVLKELRSNPETAGIPILIVTGVSMDEVEKGRLANVHIISKTDISEEQYQAFLEDVRSHLSDTNGGG